MFEARGYNQYEGNIEKSKGFIEKLSENFLKDNLRCLQYILKNKWTI